MRALIPLIIVITILVTQGAYAQTKAEQQSDSLISQGWDLYGQQRYNEADKLFSQASKSKQRAQSNQALLGMAYCQKALGRLAKATDYFLKLTQLGFKPDETVPMLLSLLLEQDRLEEAKKVLSSLPEQGQGLWQKKEHRTILQQLAWNSYNHGEYNSAYLAFARLYSIEPGNPDFLLGHCYSLQQLGRNDDAINAISSFKGEKNNKINELYLNLIKKKGVDAYEAGKYLPAKIALAEAVRMDPEDRRIEQLLQWARYKQGRPQGKLRSGFFYYYRKGDKGLSQLKATGFTLQAEKITKPSNIWNLRLSPIQLDSGSAGPNPYAGSYYRFIADPGLTPGNSASFRPN